LKVQFVFYVTVSIFSELDVKHSWKELKEMATERFKAEKSNDYLKAIKEAKRGLEDIETEAFDRFS